MGIFSSRKKQEKRSAQKPVTYPQPALFEGLSHKELEITLTKARIREYSAKDIIVKEGEPKRSFYVLLEGTAKIFKGGQGASAEIGSLGAGDVVGEIAFIRNAPRTATVAATRRVKALEFTLDGFESLPESIQLRLLKRLMELAETRVAALADQSLRMSRIEKRLVSYIRGSGGDSDVLSSDLVREVIKKIPKLPMYTRELAIKLLDEKVSPKEVAESVKLDPSLAALILKTVNSSYFGLPQKISDFSRAIVLLGMTQVYQLVLYHGIHSVMPDNPRFRTLQSHSFMLSLIAYEISLFTDRQKAGMNSTIGLLSDVGKSVVLLLKQKNPKIAPLIETIDHTCLGAELLKSWGLPDNVCDVIRLQNHAEFVRPEQIPAVCREELAALHVSQVCYKYLIEEDENAASAYFEDYAALLQAPSHGLPVFCRDKLVPALLKNESRMPAQIRRRLHTIQYEG